MKDWDFVELRLPAGKPVPFVGVGNGVDGCLGGVEEGVLNKGAAVILSRNESICFKDKALCRVSKGLMGGTPPKPSIARMHLNFLDNKELIVCVVQFFHVRIIVVI